MAGAPYEVVGIGNAIVDVIADAGEALVTGLGLVKGAMTLVDEQHSLAIYDRMGPAVEVSGGSVANTMAGFASLGGRGAYIGKVRDDQPGRVFCHDMRAMGVDFLTPAAGEGPGTARSMILVTPDAQRTMATWLGACVNLSASDLDRESLASAAIVYLEGYLYDPPAAKEAFHEAARTVHAAGGRVALSLSDSFCVDRWRDEFAALLRGHVDILLANEYELLALTRMQALDAAMAAIRPLVALAAITRGARGSVIVAGSELLEIPAEPATALVDTTGAGDLYAAGFLYGVVRQLDLATTGRLAGLAAAEVISHPGARPRVSLKALAAQAPGLRL